MLKPIIQYLVNTASWSCVNKIPQNKWLTQRTIFMGLETGSPEERELVKTNETEWGGGPQELISSGLVYFYVTSFAF